MNWITLSTFPYNSCVQRCMNTVSLGAVDLFTISILEQYSNPICLHRITSTLSQWKLESRSLSTKIIDIIVWNDLRRWFRSFPMWKKRIPRVEIPKGKSSRQFVRNSANRLFDFDWVIKLKYYKNIIDIFQYEGVVNVYIHVSNWSRSHETSLTVSLRFGLPPTAPAANAD